MLAVIIGLRFNTMMLHLIHNYTAITILQFTCSVFSNRRPLELDTDGIWCILPLSFPENFEVTCSYIDSTLFHM